MGMTTEEEKVLHALTHLSLDIVHTVSIKIKTKPTALLSQALMKKPLGACENH